MLGILKRPILQVASFVVDLIDKAGLKLNVGVVQTAYANGASTNYLANVVVRFQLFLKKEIIF